MTPEQARQQARLAEVMRGYANTFSSLHQDIADDFRQVADIIEQSTAALLIVRGEALEEAAQWHDERAAYFEACQPHTAVDHSGAIEDHRVAAAAIRALPGEEPKL